MNTTHLRANDIEPLNIWPLPATAWVEASVMGGEQSIAVTFDPRPFLAMASESELAMLARAGVSFVIVERQSREYVGGRIRAGVDVLVGRSGVFHPLFYFIGGSQPLLAQVDGVPETRWGYGV